MISWGVGLDGITTKVWLIITREYFDCEYHNHPLTWFQRLFSEDLAITAFYKN